MERTNNDLMDRILMNSTEYDAELDNAENSIDKLDSNSSKVISSPNTSKVKKRKSKKVKRDKNKSKTVFSSRLFNFNEDIAKIIQSIPELKICIIRDEWTKNVSSTTTHLLNFSMDTIKNMIPLPELKILMEIDSSNGNKRNQCIKFIGFIDVIISNDDKVDDNDKIESFISTTNETSFEIVEQQVSVISNTSSIDEFNISNSTSIDETFDYTKDEKYIMLKNIVFSNYRIYHENIIIMFGKKLKKNKLVWKLEDPWSTPHANEMKQILEDILKLLSPVENKNIIFMGCLSIVFRKTVVSFYNISETDLYNYFVSFTVIIEECLMKIKDYLWKPMIPDSELFWNGCVIVDLIMHGQKMSMGNYVNWNEIPSTQIRHNNSNGQPYLDEHHLFNYMYKKPQCDVLITHSISDLTTVTNEPSISNAVTANDGGSEFRKRSIDISSMPSTSTSFTQTLILDYGEKLIKRKKFEGDSVIPRD